MRPRRRYKTAECRRESGGPLGSQGLGLHGVPGHRPARPQFDGQWRATAIAVAAWTAQNSTFRPFQRPQLERPLPPWVAFPWTLEEGDVPLQAGDVLLSSSMTVVGLICSTRAVSRIPLPFMALSAICGFTPGKYPR